MDLSASSQLFVDGQRHQPQHAVGHRDVEIRAHPAVRPAGQRRRNGQRGLHAPGGGVGDGGAGQRWGPVGAGRGHGQEATHGEVVEVVAGPLGVRAVLAVAARGAVDDARVAIGNGGVADAQAVHHAGTEALDDHVGRLREGEESRTAVVVLQIEQRAPHAAMAAVGEELRLNGRSIG